jgi:hypothetical protein
MLYWHKSTVARLNIALSKSKLRSPRRALKLRRDAVLVMVIDTNVLVSAFLNPTGTPARLWKTSEAHRFDRSCRNPDDDLALETAVVGLASSLSSGAVRERE